MPATITGIHHVTAIASDPQANLDFYTRFLGLRFVKRTVNFDDPGTYHFYFGDNRGTPGSILTFFPWPGARRGRHGSGQVSVTSFAVPRGSLSFWQDRATRLNVMTAPAVERFGEPVLPLTDPDGLQLELIEAADPASEPVQGSDVPLEFGVVRFHSATISEEGFDATEKLLTETMGFRRTATEGNRYRFEVGEGGIANRVDVVCTPDLRRGSGGAGTVHHIAWRTPNGAQQTEWQSQLVQLHYNVTPIMDRNYFQSIYYREPGGVLFEIATDPPGFLIDETLAELGHELKLPPEYEQYRDRIEKELPAIHTGSPQTSPAPAQ